MPVGRSRITSVSITAMLFSSIMSITLDPPRAPSKSTKAYRESGATAIARGIKSFSRIEFREGIERGTSDLIVTASPSIESESAPLGDRSCCVAVGAVMTSGSSPPGVRTSHDPQSLVSAGTQTRNSATSGSVLPTTPIARR